MAKREIDLGRGDGGVWQYSFTGSDGGSLKGQVVVRSPNLPHKLSREEEKSQALAKIKAIVAELSESLKDSHA